MASFVGGGVCCRPGKQQTTMATLRPPMSIFPFHLAPPENDTILGTSDALVAVVVVMVVVLVGMVDKEAINEWCPTDEDRD